jgi:outer membrane receptor for ferric coprogen and ferric-rhodotorulic acid
MYRAFHRELTSHSGAHRLRPTLLAASIALLGLGLGPTAHAQTSSTAASSPGSYDIPAQPLGATLTRIATESGQAISIDSEMVRGLTAPPLRGSYTVEQAARQALAGSGLALTRTSSGSFTVQRANASAAASSTTSDNTLGEVIVTANADKSSTTEGTGSYTTHSVSTATKLDLSLRETPQSVSVVTRQQMDDQAVTSITDVVRNTPGVYLSSASGPGRPNFSARGFDIDYVMYDGFPTTMLSYLPSSEANMALFDRVEVVRGAAGLAQGAGNPSTAINMVRKRPPSTFQGSVALSAGSWDTYGAMVDLGGALNADGTLRGRVVASGEDAQTFRDTEANDHNLFYGVLEADVGDRTTVTVGVSQQKDHTNYIWGGLPISADGNHLDLPRSTFIGNDWEYANTHTKSAFAIVEHHFDNDWKLRLGVMQAKTDLDVLATSVWSGRRYMWAETMAQDETGYDVYASGPFKLFDRQHELVVGASRRQLDYDSGNFYGAYLPGTVDPYTWNPTGTAKPSFTRSTSFSDEVTIQDSTYLTTRLNLADPLKLILGGRLDWYNFDDRSEGSTANDDYKVTRNLTKYAGLVYDINKTPSAYISYTDVFKPQTSKDTGGNLLKPIVGKNYEVGVKGEYFDGALNISGAYFQIDQTNRARALDDQSTCPTYPSTSCYEAVGLVRSKGIDLEVQGAITPHWQVGAGFSYTETKYVKDAIASRVGTSFDTRNPTQLFKLTTLYKLQGDLQAWRVGGSVYQQSRIYTEGTNNGVKWQNAQGAYAVLDLVVGYRVSKAMDVQLNVNNVFDRTYYRNVSAGSYSPYDIYGDPRNFKLTAKYNF